MNGKPGPDLGPNLVPFWASRRSQTVPEGTNPARASQPRIEQLTRKSPHELECGRPDSNRHPVTRKGF